MFAVCDELNERIILTSDTINKLEFLEQYNVVYISESVITMTCIADDEIEDQSVSSDDDVIPLDGTFESLVKTVQDTFVDRTVTPSNQPDVDSQIRSADYITLRNEKITDPSLSKYWDMARVNQKWFLYSIRITLPSWSNQWLKSNSVVFTISTYQYSS